MLSSNWVITCYIFVIQQAFWSKMANFKIEYLKKTNSFNTFSPDLSPDSERILKLSNFEKLAFRHLKIFFLWFFNFFYVMIVKSLICCVTIQNFRPNGQLIRFLYNFKEKFPKIKFFRNFQNIELWSSVKFPRVIFGSQDFGYPHTITQEL